ncbi:MAG: choice-of-anchor Q domain-containing protein [Planctomycetaceae bacterium]
MPRRNFLEKMWTQVRTKLRTFTERHPQRRRRMGQFALESLEDRTLLTAYVVDTLDDSIASDGFISLREAIQAANTNVASGDAPAGSDVAQDTISFSETLNGGTIQLDGAQLLIDGDLSIAGPGANVLSIDAQSGSRVLQVNSGFVVEISGLTITGGSVGGFGAGILNGSDLTLRRVHVTGNAVTNGLDGAGIAHVLGPDSSLLRVIDSTISGNTTLGTGGGVFIGNDAIIINSTISGNSADRNGGGIAVLDDSLLLVNSTVTGNRSDAEDGGGGDGGGIFASSNFSSTTVYNSLIAGNFNGSGSSPNDVNGAFVAGSSHNLLGTAGTAGGLTDGTDGNIVGVGGLGTRDINTILNTTLADNGEPTLTHALVADSAAIDAGNNFRATENGQLGGILLAKDQRGLARFAGEAVDIGAVEGLDLPDTLIVSTFADEYDGDFSDGQLSLREAIEIAKVRSGAETITFRGDIVGSILLAGTELLIEDNVTIAGPGASMLTIDAQLSSRVFRVNAGFTVEISGLTITGGRSPFGGGGMINGSDLTLRQVNITGNATTNGPSGGGVLHSLGPDTALLTVIDSTISGNTSSGSGGGLAVADTAMIINSVISGNTASSSAGGIYLLTDGNLTVVDSSITGNHSFAAGGGLTSRGLTTITNSTISGNSAGTFGGGLSTANSGTIVLTNSTISGNSAVTFGGGLSSANDGTIVLTNSTVTGNRADSDDDGSYEGGGVRVSTGSVTLNNTIVAGNFAGSGTVSDDISVAEMDATLTGTFNVIGDAATAGGLVDGENGNIVGVNGVGVRDINTILNTALADNGGPTLTHALVTGSPAIDAGNLVKAVDENGATLLVDQRGFRRVLDGDGDGNFRVDIGAVEAPAQEVTGGLVFDQSNGSFRLATVVSETTVNWFQTGSLGSFQQGFIGDFDGDGLLDGMTLNPNNLRFNFFKNNGDGTLASPVSAGTLSSDYTWGNFMVGDFDGDGREEVMGQILSGPVGVGSMRSQNFNGTSQFYIRLATGYEAFVSGDFNGDGVDDILGLFDNVGETRSNIIPIISIGTPVGRRMTAILGSGQFGQSVATGGLHNLVASDFNGDGRDDIAVLNSVGQTLTASSTGTPRVNAPDARNFIVSNTSPKFLPASYPNSIMRGNFDNDILGDLFTIHDVGHLVTTSSTLTGNNLPIQTAAVDGTQSGGDKAIIGDFDGNGFDDVVVLGTNAVVFFSNGITFNPGQDFGTIIGGPIGQIGAARMGRVL